ncbi:unnamed protein product, partial [Staurois parvus]
KLYTWHNAVRQIARQRSVIGHSRKHVSTALESNGGVLYTTASTLCIALGDVRLGCSCSAMETHSMKLSTLLCLSEGHTVGDFCALCASACADPALSFYIAYHLVAELLLFPVASNWL